MPHVVCSAGCSLGCNGRSVWSMMTFAALPSVPSDPLLPFTDQLRLAVAAYLARFKACSRYHTESDLRSYLAWCAERGLDLLAARRPHLELYIRWMQEIRRFKLACGGWLTGAGVRIARMHLHMLRHTFVTTMLDAGVDLRDVQIAARHAEPRTTR
jgi:site-specific recombinase XerD